MFDRSRFARLARVHWAEHGRGTLWFLAIGSGVHVCVWLLMTQGGSNAELYTLDAQLLVYGSGYLVAGMLFAGRYFAMFASREAAQTHLMRPASVFEKSLLAFLVIAVFWPLAYTAAFQICNLPGAWLGDAARDMQLETTKDAARIYLTDLQYGPYLPFVPTKEAALSVNLLLGGIFLQGLVAAGMLAFRRLAWLKTLVALFVLVVVLIPLFTSITGASPWVLFLESGDPIVAARPGLRAWAWCLWLVVPALVWVSAHLYLRDREQA